MPNCVAPSKNVTVPLGVTGVPATADATIALNVTDCTGVAVVGFALTTVIDACCATLRLKLACAVPPLASVTVTVYVVAALATVGVPLIAPVLAFSTSPAGRPGDTLYVSGDVPPDPVTGMDEAAS
jgi:apolipoprotein N-acyltransferase